MERIPTIKVSNGQRVKIVNVSDLVYAEARGYKPMESESAPAEVPPVADEAPVVSRKKPK
jgi:hypothetical protein